MEQVCDQWQPAMAIAPPKDKVRVFHWHKDIQCKAGASDIKMHPEHESCFQMIERMTGLEGISDFLRQQEATFPAKYKGFTIAVKGNKLGITTCSKKDQFNRKIGRAVAIGRLEKVPVTFISVELEKGR